MEQNLPTNLYCAVVVEVGMIAGVRSALRYLNDYIEIYGVKEDINIYVNQTKIGKIGADRSRCRHQKAEGLRL